MADFDHPFRLRVLMSLTEHLAGITPGGGYHYDLTDAVFRGRDWYGENDPANMVSILENPQQPAPTVRGGRSKGEWDLLVQGFVDDDPVNPTDPAHMLLGDVKRRLAQVVFPADGEAPNIFDMGPGNGRANEINSMTFDGGVVRPPEAFVSVKAHFWLNVTLSLTENLNNPFA